MTLSITASTTTLEAQSEALLTRAAELEALWYTGPRMWFGTSGEPVTGTQVAEHLEIALRPLELEGWQPGTFGLWEVLDGPMDVKGVAVSVLELVMRPHRRQRGGAAAVGHRAGPDLRPGPRPAAGRCRLRPRPRAQRRRHAELG